MEFRSSDLDNSEIIKALSMQITVEPKRYTKLKKTIFRINQNRDKTKPNVDGRIGLDPSIGTDPYYKHQKQIACCILEI